MKLLSDQISKVMGCSPSVAEKYCAPLNACFDKFGINTHLHIAAFLAQVGHESGRLSQVVENLNYSADALRRTWPSRFMPDLAIQVARQPDRIANIVYGGRMGNVELGDGWKYRGRGLIQITGRDNYAACSKALFGDDRLLRNPELLEQPEWACMSAAWFWDSRGLNSLADKGDIVGVTKKINGGTNGLEDRKALYEKALKVLA